MKFFEKKPWKYVRSLSAAVVSAFIMSVANNCFLEEAGLLPGGFMGLSKIINLIGNTFGITIPATLIYFLFNTVIAAICIKSISKKFVLFSAVQFLSLTLFMELLPSIPIFEDAILLNVIFGGVIWGFGTSVALRTGGSTGGTDFIALFVSNKTGNEIWTQVFMVNCCQLVLFGYISGWEKAGYSIIFQYISTRMINMFHNRYKRVMLQIFTKKPQEICSSYMEHFAHGITILKGTGAYTGTETCLLTAITSSYETEDAIRVIQSADPKAIINVTKSDRLVGNFQQPAL